MLCTVSKHRNAQKRGFFNEFVPQGNRFLQKQPFYDKSYYIFF